MSCKEKFLRFSKRRSHAPGRTPSELSGEQKATFHRPASARYHLACEGGLCERGLNVYQLPGGLPPAGAGPELYGLEYSEESVAVVALLHDLCKVGCYKKTFRNVKDDATGKWEKVPSYQFDDPLPYGHGEKSVYIANGFIRLTREEAMAIRWHMGFSGSEDPRPWARPCKNTPWPSPWPPPTWRPATSWRGSAEPLQTRRRAQSHKDWSAAAFSFIPPACRPRDCGSVGPVCRNPTASRCWSGGWGR